MDAKLGKAARLARRQHGLRIIDVATLAGLTESGLSKWERDARFSPRTNQIVAAYAEALRIEPEDLWRAALDLDD